jgi:putative sigma-54 modulation protein
VDVRTIVKGKNYEVPERVRAYAERKLGRLERLLDDRSDATVELSVEQHRSVRDSHIVDVTLVIDGQTLRSSSAAPTHQAGIDAVLDKIERRAVDHRETSRVRKSSETVRGGGRAELEAQVRREPEERRGQIVKVKRFQIEPMFEEDAVARMEELGHAFFVFVDAENERVAILYRRADGDYGLIEPVLGGGYTKGGPPRRSGPH